MSNLLPPNATAIERNLAATGAAIDEIPVPIRDISDPAACPPAVLPFLAWERSVDRWDPQWPIATKRAVIEASFFVHQRKGTVGALRRALAPLGTLTQVTQWWQLNPPGPRATFALEVLVEGGYTPALHAEIERLIDATKPVSRHLSSLTIAHQVKVPIPVRSAVQLGDILTVGPAFPEIRTEPAMRSASCIHTVEILTVTAQA